MEEAESWPGMLERSDLKKVKTKWCLPQTGIAFLLPITGQNCGVESLC